MCRSQEKILAQKVNEKFFTVDPYLMDTGVRWTFRIFSFFYVWAFLGKKLSFKFKKKVIQIKVVFDSVTNFWPIFIILDFLKNC